MTADLVFENTRDPSLTPPKPHRSGLPVLADKRPPLPSAMQPVLEDGRALLGDRVTVARGRGFPGSAGPCMQAARGLEVYVRLDNGCAAWFPIDEIDPATPVAVENYDWFQVPG